MLKIDENLLNEIGLGTLSVDDKNRMLAQIYETLEMRVGVTLAKQMSDEQLQEFEQYINANDESGALTWLETNFPNYKDVVARELSSLKEEIKANSQQIIQSIQQQAAAAQAEPTQPPASGVPQPSAPPPSPQPQAPTAPPPPQPNVQPGVPPPPPPDVPPEQMPPSQPPGTTVDPTQQQ